MEINLHTIWLPKDDEDTVVIDTDADNQRHKNKNQKKKNKKKINNKTDHKLQTKNTRIKIRTNRDYDEMNCFYCCCCYYC